MSTANRPTRLLPHDPVIRLPVGDEVIFEELYRNPDKHSLPDHTHLPDREEKFVQNFQEHPQSVLLTDTIGPLLDRRHPDGRYAVGQDCGIYWKLVDPPVRGAICPDWFYVPDVPPQLEGVVRRSYVLWQEEVPPLVALEFVSGDGSEERDRTPMSGKFWIYENVIRPVYYGIYEFDPGRIEFYHLVNGRFELLTPNDRGHFPIDELGVELGLWDGHYLNQTFSWMRWWDQNGVLLPTGHEQAEIEARRAASEARRAASEARRADREGERADREGERADREAGLAAREADRAERLAAQLRALGIEPEA